MWMTIRRVVAAVAAVLLAVLAFNPDIAGFLLVQAGAADCRSPAAMPEGAGALWVADTRGTRPDRLIDDEPAHWADRQTRILAADRDPARPLVVYVHGFRTTPATAACVGDGLRHDLAQRAGREGRPGPDVLVFGWPGEFGPAAFSTAQAYAVRAAPYLGELLARMADRRTVVVAHSLGAQVALDALAGLDATDGAGPIAAVALVQGAVPAAGIRRWSMDYRISFPAAELADLARGAASPPPIAGTEEGTGTLVPVLGATRLLIVTTAARDATLSRWFSTDELFNPFDTNRPLVLPEIGQAARRQPQTLAVGSPFPDGPIFRRWDQMLPEPFDERTDPADLPRTRLVPDESRVLARYEWTYRFWIDHSGYQALPLESIVGWRPLFDWHSPLNDAAVRPKLLGQIWRMIEDTPASP